MVLGTVSRLVTRRLVPKQNGGVVNKKRDYFSGGYDPDERPGRNMPLTIKNRAVFTLGYTIFWFTGIGTPFYAVYFHMTKG